MSANLLLAAAEGGLGQMVGEVAHRFGVNGQLLISQILSFCVVAFLLHRFAYRPVLRVLDERRQRIQESLENAEKIKAELARTEAARKEVLQKAGEQANQIIEEARTAASRVLEEETRKARAAAEEILERARQAGETELARLKAELRREMGRLVAETTGRVIGRVLTPEEHQRLIQEAERELTA
ncbi:MAG: ATP synthase F0 subunit B [Verrucomicrobia bacterium]|nr:MAG: ATP synthase F0 subunit B [Verrucomicrobiota bacterium]